MIAARRIAGAALDQNGEETAAARRSPTSSASSSSTRPSSSASRPKLIPQIERRLEQLRAKGIGASCHIRAATPSAKPGDWRVELGRRLDRLQPRSRRSRHRRDHHRPPAGPCRPAARPVFRRVGHHEHQRPQPSGSRQGRPRRASARPAPSRPTRSTTCATRSPPTSSPSSTCPSRCRPSSAAPRSRSRSCSNSADGSVLELDRRVGEAIDIYVNSRLVARGEVVVVDDRLGVTMTEIIKNSDA